GVVVLLQLEVDGLGGTVAAVASVGLAESDAEALGLIQLRGGEQPGELAAEACIGVPATQVVQEGVAIDPATRPNGVCLDGCEKLSPSLQAAAQEIRGTVAFGEVAPIAVDASPSAHDLTHARTRSLRSKHDQPPAAGRCASIAGRWQWRDLLSLPLLLHQNGHHARGRGCALRRSPVQAQQSAAGRPPVFPAAPTPPPSP